MKEKILALKRWWFRVTNYRSYILNGYPDGLSLRRSGNTGMTFGEYRRSLPGGKS